MQTIKANGAEIPIIGLGTWQLSGAAGARIVEQALRLGYRHLDTAQIYENEREVGEGLRNSGVRRRDVFVVTKIWHTNLAPRDLERATKESLVRLRLSEVDLLLIHWPNPAVPLADTIGALCKMKTDGLARHIGVSNFTVALLDEAVHAATEPLVCNQFEYHPFLNQDKIVTATRQHGMAVVAYSPVARGKTKGNRVLEGIGEKYGKTAAQVSLRWLVQQDAVVIPRTSRVERLSENFEIFDFELSADEMAAIAGLADPEGRITRLSWAPQWD